MKTFILLSALLITTGCDQFIKKEPSQEQPKVRPTPQPVPYIVDPKQTDKQVVEALQKQAASMTTLMQYAAQRRIVCSLDYDGKVFTISRCFKRLDKELLNANS